MLRQEAMRRIISLRVSDEVKKDLFHLLMEASNVARFTKISKDSIVFSAYEKMRDLEERR